MRVWLYVHQQGLHTGEPKDYRKQEILPLKNVPQILDSPRPDSETVIWKELGSAALLILGSLPERQKQRGLLLGMEKLAAAIHRSLSTAKTLVMMRAIWSSPSSLRGLEIFHLPQGWKQPRDNPGPKDSHTRAPPHQTNAQQPLHKTRPSCSNRGSMQPLWGYP